jgi:hypothetical protein
MQDLQQGEAMTSDRVSKTIDRARKEIEEIAESSCVWGRAQGWKVRWEWRGNSMWIIDETELPATENEMCDIVTLPEALHDLEAQGNG